MLEKVNFNHKNSLRFNNFQISYIKEPIKNSMPGTIGRNKEENFGLDGKFLYQLVLLERMSKKLIL